MKTENFKQCYESVHSVFILVTCINCKFLFYFLRICFILGYPYNFRYLVIASFNFTVYDIVYMKKKKKVKPHNIRRITKYKRKHRDLFIFNITVFLTPFPVQFFQVSLRRLT